MSTITRERAQEIFLGNGPEPTASEERELVRIALASLEAEPVAWRCDSGSIANRRVVTVCEVVADSWTEKGMDVSPLYAAPHAPEFPDEMAISDDMNLYQKSFAQGHNACRAAMLQGADVNSPDDWVACSERMPHIGVPVITCCGDVVQYAAYAWDGKEWQDWYEEYDKLPANTFTHWHPRPAAPQQEVK